VLLVLQELASSCFPSGNLPSSLGKDSDELVHWCHGATGGLPAACCLLPAACCLLPAACCLLPTAASCLLPAACCS
jgi:hypothetical protein